MLKYEIISHVDALPVYYDCTRRFNQLIPSHWHHHLEIIYVLEGTMDLNTPDHHYLLKTYDMFVVNPGVVHLTKTTGYAKILLLQIPYDFLSTSIPNLSSVVFRDYFDHKQLSSTETYKLITSSLDKLMNIYNDQVDGYPFLFNSTLNQLLYQLYTNYTKLSSGPSLLTDKNRIHIQKAFDYMTSHYAEHISLADISNHLALNPEYFCRLFKKQVGFTFLEYLNQIRITYIYNDLTHSDESITTIRERHGFTNYKVFNRLFKETYGMTPSKLRSIGKS